MKHLLLLGLLTVAGCSEKPKPVTLETVRAQARENQADNGTREYMNKLSAANRGVSTAKNQPPPAGAEEYQKAMEKVLPGYKAPASPAR